MHEQTTTTLHPARLLLISITASVFALFLLAADAARAQGQQSPISKDGLVKVLQLNALSGSELVQVIRQRGVDFTLTADNRAALESAGASAEVIAAVRANYRGGSADAALDRRQGGGTSVSTRQPPLRSADEYFKRAGESLQAGRQREALEDYLQVIRLAPNFPGGHFGAGLAYLLLNQARDAVPAFEQTVRLKPDFAEAYLYMGHARVALGEAQEALASPRWASARSGLRLIARW